MRRGTRSSARALGRPPAACGRPASSRRRSRRRWRPRRARRLEASGSAVRTPATRPPADHRSGTPDVPAHVDARRRCARARAPASAAGCAPDLRHPQRALLLAGEAWLRMPRASGGSGVSRLAALRDGPAARGLRFRGRPDTACRSASIDRCRSAHGRRRGLRTRAGSSRRAHVGGRAPRASGDRRRRRPTRITTMALRPARRVSGRRAPAAGRPAVAGAGADDDETIA